MSSYGRVLFILLFLFNFLESLVANFDRDLHWNKLGNLFVNSYFYLFSFNQLKQLFIVRNLLCLEIQKIKLINFPICEISGYIYKGKTIFCYLCRRKQQNEKRDNFHRKRYLIPTETLNKSKKPQDLIYVELQWRLLFSGLS